MKLLLLAAVLGFSAAAPQNYYQPYQQAYRQYQARAREGLDRNARILRSDSEVNEAGFRYAFETENGIQAQESGVENNGIQAQGGYSYTGDDGQLYSIQYTADVNGFQAQGAHLPTPPPIPEEIRQALIKNAQDEANGIFDDGSYHEGKYSPGSGVFAARNYQPFRQTARPYNF